MATKPKATIEDLYRVSDNGKAEIVNGELVLIAPTGFLPSRASLNIAASMRQYERLRGIGHAFADKAGFRVNLPHRESFSPDAAFYTGRHTGMRFLEGDYGPAAERALAGKRADYFAAGTLIVWDVDLLGDDTIRVYRASAPDQPTIYRRGEVAEAEPALPGWRMPVDELFA
jgi:Uma2 family endonuclease